MLNNIKILVCYHKPAKLYKDDVCVPIHVGRALATQASKDGKINQDDYQWLLDNMIGDDTGDNISHLNRHFAELTAIYWAWKNYDKLGNPDYIGLAHYRRIFAPQDIKNAVNYDITAHVDKVYSAKTIDHHFDVNHHTNDLHNAIDLLDKKYTNVAKQYLQRTDNSFHYNMFIMKRDLFFEYCEFLFGALMQMHKTIDYNKYSQYNQRMPGFVAERLIGIFVSEKESRYKVKTVPVIFKEVSANTPIKPAFADAICVCLASDDNYAMQLGVTIASIKANKSKNDKYDICVLDGGITELNKKRILQMADSTFSIRFINISGFMDDFDTKIFSLKSHFTIATYFRFFIPQIFANYTRILYIDCDLVINHNLSELYYYDLGKFAIGAVKDFEITRRIETDPFYDGNANKYLTNTLKMKNPSTYFQAGVLLLDIAKLQEQDFTNRCIDRLKQIRKPLYVDQCILNSLLDGQYKSIDCKWNVMWQMPIFVHDLDRQLDIVSYNSYMESRENPYIVHYAGSKKPWTEPQIDLAEIWWKYARMTPFYEQFLFNRPLPPVIAPVISKLSKNEYRHKYQFHRFMSHITFGKMHKKHQKSARHYKKIIKTM